MRRMDSAQEQLHCWEKDYSICEGKVVARLRIMKEKRRKERRIEGKEKGIRDEKR